jgi:hypothetical protein
MPALNKNMLPMITASAVTLGGAATTILIYIIQQTTGITLPEQVDEAILVLIESAFAFGAHRLTN